MTQKEIDDVWEEARRQVSGIGVGERADTMINVAIRIAFERGRRASEQATLNIGSLIQAVAALGEAVDRGAAGIVASIGRVEVELEIGREERRSQGG